MIRTTRERDIVTRRAREWRDRLRNARTPSVTLDTAQRAELARVLDELQHFAVHGPVGGGVQ